MFTRTQPRIRRALREGLRTPHAYPLKRAEPNDSRGRICEHSDQSNPDRIEKEKTMSAANVETRVETEIDLVEQWRHEELWRAGYNAEAAVVLAASHDVDLHLAVDLLQRGCSQELALQILL